MTIVRRHIFDGDSGGSVSPDSYGKPAADIESRNALSSALSASRGSEKAYKAAQAAVTGEQPGGSAGFELEHSDDPRDDTELETTGSVPGEEFGTTTLGSDQLVTRDTLPKDSNLAAGGRAL